MRGVVCVVFVMGCGNVVAQAIPDAAGGGAAMGDAAPSDAVAVDAVPACSSFTEKWQTTETAFEAEVAPVVRISFNTRGDGVTQPSAGAIVPRDEYLACCGIQLEFIGTGGGQLIWTGNPTSGFAVSASCSTFPCQSPGGVRVTFASPVAALGYDYPGNTSAVMFDAQNQMLSTMTESGSGDQFFLGYESPSAGIKAVEANNGSSEEVESLLYHPCR